MNLSNELISQFVKVTNDTPEKNKESTVYGIIVKYGVSLYVKLDGSDLLTPITTTANIKEGNRVMVMIKNHSAIVIGNVSSPSASDSDLKEIDKKITEFYAIVANKIDVERLEAEIARINVLTADNVTIKKSLKAVDADIEELKTKKLDAESADLKYANVEFSNITKVAIKTFFTDSGLIKNVTIGDGTITGELVGVTIKGDMIEGHTIVADKLVIKGEDGLFYKLNVDALGETTAASDPKYQNGLDGSAIIAKSITAEKVDVHDLVAFGATIGGFHIADHAIYSGVKESVNNTTRGTYLDDEGQFALGDADNFIKFFKDTDGNYKLAISAESLVFSMSKKSIEEAIQDVDKKVDNSVEALKDEISTLLRIESSKGTVFKNDNVSTVLSAVIYHGSKRITESTTLKTVFSETAHLQWSWQRLNEDSYGIISADDHRITNDGFSFVISPNDVDTKITFMCELII